MKKIVMVLLTVLMTVGMHAGNGTRVKVKLVLGVCLRCTDLIVLQQRSL